MSPRSTHATGLRVLLSPSAYYPHVGGIEEITRRLALGLVARGHGALVVVNRWPAGTPAEEVLDGVRVRRITMALPAASPGALFRFAAGGPRAAAQLLGVAGRFRPHVVHLVGAGPNGAYAAALRRVLAPLVLTAQGELRNDAHGVYERSLTLRLALRSLLLHAAVVTAPSRATLAELEASFTVRGRREVVPNGVDPAELAGAPPEGNRLGRYVLAAGRLVPQKGFDVLLEAFAAARPALGGRRLVFAGDGDLRGELEAQAARLGLGADVSFLGAVGRERLASLLCGADAFAFPSRREAFGMALVEAMAAGVPSVAAASEGVRDYAVDGENALVVPPGDAQALAAALARVVGDEPLRARLRAGGAATAAEVSWDRILDRYEAIYWSVARLRLTPAGETTFPPRAPFGDRRWNLPVPPANTPPPHAHGAEDAP